MKNKWVIWAIAAVAIIGVGYLALKPASGAEGVVNVGAAKVQKLVGDPSVQVVDVRTAGEYQAGHLSGAQNVPVDQIQSAAQSWDRSKALLVYCATGARSSSAVQQLESMGFKTIYHFSQGLVAWQGALVNGAGDSAGQQVAQNPTIKTNGTPVMYEFFTDW